MQTQHGAAAEEAILGAERTFRARVLIDWDRDESYDHALSDVSHFIESINTDRALSGSMPAEILLVEGSSAAELSMTLGGEFEGQQLPVLFSPYNPNSPFFKQVAVGAEIQYSIIVDTALGQFEYPQFVGNVRLVTPDRASNTVQIEALDRVEKLRKPVKLPPWALDEGWARRDQRVKSQVADSTWFIDTCLRMCDTSPTPWRPMYREDISLDYEGQDGCQLWISGTGSYLPTIGYSTRTLVTQYPPVESWGLEMFQKFGVTHPDSPEPTNRPYQFASVGRPQASTGDHRYWIGDRDVVDPRSLHVFEFTLSDEGQNGTYWRGQADNMLFQYIIGGVRAIEVRVGANQVWSRLVTMDAGTSPTGVDTRTSPKVTVPSGQGSVRIRIMWDLTPQTGSKVHITAGTNTSGTDWSSAGAVIPAAADINPNRGWLTAWHSAAYADISYSVRDTFGLSPDQAAVNGARPAKYAAVLDAGLQKLTYTPVLKGDSAWEIITAAAAAEQGSVFWDENGVFHYWNYDRIRQLQQTPVRTFTLDDLSNLALGNSLDSVRNIWSLNYSKKTSTYTVAYNGNSADEFVVQNGQDAKIRLWLDNVIATNPARLGRVAGADWTEGHTHHYVLQFQQSDGSWAEESGRADVNARTYHDADGNLVLRVTNNSGRAARFAKDGSAAIRVEGNVITDFDTIVQTLRNNRSVQLYGPRNLKLEGDWIQDGFSESTIRNVLMPRTLEPTPATDDITVAGDPRIQLGDTVLLSDPGGFGPELKVQIIGISRTLSLSEGLTDVYTIQLVSAENYVPPIVDPEPPAVTRVNLCPNPSAKNNASGYFGPSGSARITGLTGMPRTTGYSQGGTGLLIGPRANVKPGESYVFSCYIRGHYGAASGRVNIDWYNRWGLYIGSTPSVSWTVADQGVIRVNTGAYKAPAGAKQGLLVLSQQSTRVVMGSLLYEQTAVSDSYFDGDSSGARWNGSNGNSSSTLG